MVKLNDDHDICAVSQHWTRHILRHLGPHYWPVVAQVEAIDDGHAAAPTPVVQPGVRQMPVGLELIAVDINLPESSATMHITNEQSQMGYLARLQSQHPEHGVIMQAYAKNPLNTKVSCRPNPCSAISFPSGLWHVAWQTMLIRLDVIAI